MKRRGAVHFLAGAVITAITTALLPGAAGAGPPATAPVAGATTAAPEAVFPVTVSSGDGSVTIPARPVRILCLSASATQMLYALGAGPQVVGVDEYSTWPANAPRTKFTGAETSAEDYLPLRPDLELLRSGAVASSSSCKSSTYPLCSWRRRPRSQTSTASWPSWRQLPVTGPP